MANVMKKWLKIYVFSVKSSKQAPATKCAYVFFRADFFSAKLSTIFSLIAKIV